MKLVDRMKTLFKSSQEEKAMDLNEQKLLNILGINREAVDTSRLSEITYFTCLRLLSENIGKLPLKMLQDTSQGIVKANNHPLHHILKLRPNPYMTSSAFWQTVELIKNHYGNTYVYYYIRQKNFWILEPGTVRILIDDAGLFGNPNALYYEYTDKKTGKVYVFPHTEILHFRTSMSFNGIHGLAVREILEYTIENAQHSARYLNEYYKNGLMNKAVLYYTGELSDKSAEKMANALLGRVRGVSNSTVIPALPIGMKLDPLNITMADAEFHALSKYTALQIAGAFGIKPNQINDYDKGNYANVESQQRDFYINTSLATLKAYEEELTYKTLTQEDIAKGYRWKFNVNGVLRGDYQTQIEGLAKGINNAIYTPNEARDQIDMVAKPGGDKLFMNGNYSLLEDIAKGGDSNSNA